MTIKDVDRNKITPMMRQYLKIKDENPDIIILYRLGDFYEAFFEDAIKISKDLEIALTGRNAGLEERVPMCGVPYHAVDMYIEKLVEKGYKVGICEQLEDPKEAKGIVERGLTQIISKGTITNSAKISENEFNYIGSVIDFKHAYALSYMDITTGSVYVKLIKYSKSVLVNEIMSIGIKELVIFSSLDIEIVSLLKNQLGIQVSVSDDYDTDNYSNLYADIADERLVRTLKHLFTYISTLNLASLSHLKSAIVVEDKNYLKMDIHTKRNLELTETLRLKQRENSLIWLLDKTKTAMGSRLLKNYIENPLIDIKEINERYDVVETLLEEFILKEDLKNLLYEVYDIERLVGRIVFGNANGRDLLQLKNSLRVLPEIKNILKSIKFSKTYDDLYDLFKLIDDSIYENPPLTLKDGYLIKSGYNKELDELKDIRSGGKDFVAKFENEEKERTGIKSLKVGYNKVFGYYIEVSKGMTNLVKEEYGYERKQTLSNCERYISPILKEKEALILNAEDRIIALEYKLFVEVRDKIKEYIVKLQKVSNVIAEIDVLQSFATVTEENNYVRPNLVEKREVRIIDNRHAVVEKVLQNEYVANDIIMDENTNILLITGPNMAGKSTYMRQFAITVIMAQIGCFVPASEAMMPIFDAIYTRIGASDDLVSGESTFMVEMNEANNAIVNASENSLILFDELGRGTATYDGMSLAQAIIEYIHDNIKCKMMFSTHYHELTELSNRLTKLRNVHVSAHEENGNVTFLHKIKEGSVDKSYGIHVAKLANLPSSLIKRAKEVLATYETGVVKKDVIVQESISFDEEPTDRVREMLEEVDPLTTTPIEALNIIYKLKEEIKK